MRKQQMWAAATLLMASMTALAAGPVVGVSWSNFQEERWKTDEAAIKAELARLGASYVSADAGGSPEKQIGDVESLLAKAVLAAKPQGRYVMIKGSPSDPNADFLRAGQQDALADAVKKGDVKIVAEEYTDGWKPEVAQKNMEQILTKLKGGVDAVVASNDGTAGGAIAALSGKGIKGVPVSGQDADHAALNRIALGTQTVTVWKDSRALGKEAAAAAVQLAAGQKVPGAAPWAGGERKVSLQAKFLAPVAITQANLGAVISAGWVPKAVVCKGVDAAKAPAACK